jgi:hypothetical protein
MTIKKAYYYFYYNIYNFFINISDDILNRFKPVIIIAGLEVFLFIDFFNWYSILTKNGDIATLPYFLAVLVVALFNSYVFLHGDKYKKYFPEFKNYSKQKKVIGGWITFIIIILVVASVIFSFYEMSLIDWKQYR